VQSRIHGESKFEDSKHRRSRTAPAAASLLERSVAAVVASVDIIAALESTTIQADSVLGRAQQFADKIITDSPLKL